MKKYKLIIILLSVILFFALYGLITQMNKKWDGVSDYKIGIITGNEAALISFSTSRNMINTLRINGDSQIWFNQKGLWTSVNQVVKDINKQNLDKDLKELFFYNFGFFPDKVAELNNVDDWKNDAWLISNFGLFNWFKIKIKTEKMMAKEEVIRKDVENENLLLDEVMMRDFADNRIINEDLRLTIANASATDGLAGFIDKRLEWAGYSVVSTINSLQKVNKCLFAYGPKVETTIGWKMLAENFDCEKKYDGNLNDMEIELYFGEDYVSMIKYSSYVRTF